MLAVHLGNLSFCQVLALQLDSKPSKIHHKGLLYLILA